MLYADLIAAVCAAHALPRVHSALNALREASPTLSVTCSRVTCGTYTSCYQWVFGVFPEGSWKWISSKTMLKGCRPKSPTLWSLFKIYVSLLFLEHFMLKSKCTVPREEATRGEAVSGLCFVICETQWLEYVSYNTCHGIEEAGPSVTSEERNLRTKTWGWEYPAVQTQESYTLGAVQANTPTVASRMKMLYRKGSYRFERNGQPWTDFKMWVRVMDTHHCYAIKCPRCCCQLQSTLERKLLS